MADSYQHDPRRWVVAVKVHRRTRPVYVEVAETAYCDMPIHEAEDMHRQLGEAIEEAKRIRQRRESK